MSSNDLEVKYLFLNHLACFPLSRRVRAADRSPSIFVKSVWFSSVFVFCVFVFKERRFMGLGPLGGASSLKGRPLLCHRSISIFADANSGVCDGAHSLLVMKEWSKGHPSLCDRTGHLPEKNCGRAAARSSRIAHPPNVADHDSANGHVANHRVAKSREDALHDE